jgi:hypothetical protein
MNILIDQICVDRTVKLDPETPDLSYWELMNEWVPAPEPDLPSSQT